MENKTQSTKKHYKTFKEYYSNAEYRTKHLNYINEKVPCKFCSALIARHYMTKHHKTQVCKKNTVQKAEELKEVIEKKLQEYPDAESFAKFMINFYNKIINTKK